MKINVFDSYFWNSKKLALISAQLWGGLQGGWNPTAGVLVEIRWWERKPEDRSRGTYLSTTHSGWSKPRDRRPNPLLWQHRCLHEHGNLRTHIYHHVRFCHPSFITLETKPLAHQTLGGGKLTPHSNPQRGIEQACAVTFSLHHWLLALRAALGSPMHTVIGARFFPSRRTYIRKQESGQELLFDLTWSAKGGFTSIVSSGYASICDIS